MATIDFEAEGLTPPQQPMGVKDALGALTSGSLQGPFSGAFKAAHNTALAGGIKGRAARQTGVNLRRSLTNRQRSEAFGSIGRVLTRSQDPGRFALGGRALASSVLLGRGDNLFGGGRLTSSRLGNFFGVGGGQAFENLLFGIQPQAPTSTPFTGQTGGFNPFGVAAR